MTLQAPEHLRGDMRNADQAITIERREWVSSALHQGHTWQQISDALGISRTSVGRIADAIDFHRKRQDTVLSLRRAGIKTGSLDRQIDAMPKPARSALADRAARARKPMAAVLADFWAQHHGAQV